jgi:hypothetical protein
MISSMVTGDVTPLNYMDDFQGSVTLVGLDRLTTYFYRVMATNDGGNFTIFTAVGTFNTTSQGTCVAMQWYFCIQDIDWTTS